LVELADEALGLRRMLLVDVPKRKPYVELVIPNNSLDISVKKENGDAVGNAIVRVTSPSEATGQIPAAFSDPDGRVTLRGLEEGLLWIVAETKEGAFGELNYLVAEGENEVEVTVRQSEVLAGRVLADGQPLPGVRVAAKAEGRPTPANGTTDQEGRFRVRLAGGTTRATLVLEAGGFVRRAVDVGLPTEAIEVHLSSAGGGSLVLDPIPTDLGPETEVQLVVHRGVALNATEWAFRSGSPPVDGEPLVVPMLEEGPYSVCRGTIAALQRLLQSGSVRDGSCRHVDLPAYGEARVSSRQ
jgi:hypothetical protein